MPAPQVTQAKQPSSQPLSKEEEEVLHKMEEEERATSAAKDAADNARRLGMAVAAASTLANRPPAPRPAQMVQKRMAGDIPVTCLKTEVSCRMGGRVYVLKKGAEIEMDPSHANELSQGPDPYVMPVHVVSTAR